MPALAAVGSIPGQPAPSRRCAARLDLLDYTLFLPGIWLACGLGMSLRLIGPLFVAVPVGSCLLYAITRRVVPPRLLASYVALCVFAAALSKYQLYPDSWQVHFMAEAVIRQLTPLMGFFAIAWASKAYFRHRLLIGDMLFGAPLFLLLGFVVAPAIMLYEGQGYQGDHSFYAVLATSGAFINNTVLGGFFIIAEIFLTRGWRRHTGLAAIVAIAASSHFIQFRIFVAVALALLIGVPARRLLIGLATALPVTYAVAMNFTPTLMATHPNEAIRLAFVSDTLTSAVDTRGVGIGYGKESVRWVYRYPNVPDFHFLPDAQFMTHQRMLEALSNGVENSFAQALLRTGVPGLLLLSAAIFAAFPPSNLPQNVKNHAAALFAMMFTALFVNAALEQHKQRVPEPALKVIGGSEA